MGDGYRHKATINVNNESVILGTFDSPKEVALAYDSPARQCNSPITKLNLSTDNDDEEMSDNDTRKEEVEEEEEEGEDDDDFILHL